MTGSNSAQEQSHPHALAARLVIGAVPAPWGRIAALLDAYEGGIRVTSDALHAFARAVDVDPLRTIATMSADAVRDIGAAQVSTARWLLDA
jgi:hypothetical protein